MLLTVCNSGLLPSMLISIKHNEHIVMSVNLGAKPPYHSPLAQSQHGIHSGVLPSQGVESRSPLVRLLAPPSLHSS